MERHPMLMVGCISKAVLYIPPAMYHLARLHYKDGMIYNKSEVQCTSQAAEVHRS